MTEFIRTLTAIVAVSGLLSGCGPAKVNPPQPEDASNKPKNVDTPFKTIEAGDGYGAATISGDGTRLFVTTEAGKWNFEFQVYDVATSKKIASTEIFLKPDIAYSESANLVAYCNCQRPYALVIVDGTTGAEKLRIMPDKLRFTDVITSLHFSPNGELIVVATKYGITTFNTKSGKEVFQIPDTYEYARTSCFFDDGKKIAYTEPEGVVSIWDIPQNKKIKSIKNQGKEDHYRLLGTDDGKYLATQTNHEELIRIWNTETGEMVRELKSDSSTWYEPCFIPKTHWLVFKSKDLSEFGYMNMKPDLSIVDVETAQLKCTLSGQPSFLSSISCTTDGKTLVTAYVHDRKVCFWDIGNLK